MTVQEMIRAVIEKTGLQPIKYEATCDHLMTGSPDMEVRKIITTFMATVDVIRQAAESGANLIITHEPTWFSGADDTGWLESDLVYSEKKKLISQNHIAIWRFHDHMHLDKKSGDGIYRGFDQETGWGKYRLPESGENPFGACYEIPEQSMEELCHFFKNTLDMPKIRVVGNPDMRVRRVSVLVGGGSLGLGVENRPMIHMRENNIDVVVCGDITEWTLSAYVRDASQLGMNKGMIILGHEKSEECGMKHLTSWLQDLTGDIPVEFIDSGEPFLYL